MSFSLSEMLKQKRRVKIISIAACLLLLVAAGVLLLINARGTKAAYIWDGTNLTLTDCGTDKDSDDGMSVRNVMVEGENVAGAGQPQRVRIYGTCGGSGVFISPFPANGNITVNNTHVFIYSVGVPFKANSITVNNGGVLTHSKILPSNVMADGTTFVSGFNKKLDITVSGTFALNGTGMVDVTGKGYPGGDFTGWSSSTNTPAYGPGHGRGMFENGQDGADGSGAGYGGMGGDGGRGSGLGGPAYPSPFDWLTPSLYHGSGGGSAYDGGHYNESKASGGNGGGFVHIKASSINILSTQSTIVAEGSNSNSHKFSDDNQAMGGGGSGGTIWLDTDNFTFPSGGYNANIFGGLGHDNGDIGSLTILTQLSSTPTNVSVKGGNSGLNSPCTSGDCGGGGGGGRIFIGKSLNNYSSQKILEPISRSGVSPATNFNPYALQKGDRIRVKIYIGGSSGTFTIKDDLLQTKYLTPNYTCVPDTTKFSPINPTPLVNDPLIWSNFDISTAPISYECVVQ